MDEKNNSNRIYCCNKCANRLHYKNNYRKSTQQWKCYICGNLMDIHNGNNNIVAQRNIDFFTKKTRKKIIKVPKKINDEVVIKNNKVQFDEKIILVQKKTKRKFKDTDVIDRKEILKKLKENDKKDPYKKNIYDIRNPAFIAFLFLTGARVEEVIGVREHTGKLKDSVFEKKAGKWTGKYIIEPIIKNQISKTKYAKRDTITWDVENMPVLKRRGESVADENDILNESIKQVVPRRHVSLPYEIEKEFISYIDKWLIKLKEDEIIFNFSPQQAWRICFLFNRSYNHIWRHLRATDLMSTYGLGSLELRHFFGWSTEAMARRYAHLNKYTLLDSMLVGFQNKGEKIE